MRLAFLDLPDDRIDLIPLATRVEDVEVALVVHEDPRALALQVADALRIPRSNEPLDLLSLKPDRVALPSRDTPSAAALVRAGISARIFMTLEELDAESRLAELADALRRAEDRSGALRDLLRIALDAGGAPAGAVLLFEPEGRRLVTVVSEGVRDEEQERLERMRLPESSGRGDGTALHVEPCPPTGGRRTISGARASAAVPIRAETGQVGVLAVFRRSPFSEDEIASATVAAGRIAPLLERVRESGRRAVDSLELRARRAVERAFEGTGDPWERRLQRALSLLLESLGSGAVRAYLAEPERGRFRILSARSSGNGDGSAPMDGGFVEQALRTAEPAYLALVSRGRSAGPRSASAQILAPIPSENPWGVLAIEGPPPGASPDEAIRIAERVAGHLDALVQAGRSEPTARHGVLLTRLADLAPRIMAPRDVDSLASEALGSLQALFGRGLVSVRLGPDPTEQTARRALADAERGGDGLQALDEELAQLVLRRGVESSSVAAGDGGMLRGEVEFIAVPVRAAERVVGSLGVCVPGSGPETGSRVLGAAELEAVRKLALYVGLAWERIHFAPAAAAPTYRDSLTGLLAGPGLEVRIVDEVKRAERYHDRILLTLCSISGYEALVQRHGVAWGEGLLRDFARALARNVREVDVVARVGGGRFAVLSPETEKNHGALLRRLDQLLPSLEQIQALPDAREVALVGRQYSFPDEVPTGAELLALVRSSYAVP